MFAKVTWQKAFLPTPLQIQMLIMNYLKQSLLVQGGVNPNYVWQLSFCYKWVRFAQVLIRAQEMDEGIADRR